MRVPLLGLGLLLSAMSWSSFASQDKASYDGIDMEMTGDPLYWCSYLPRRNINEINDRIFRVNPETPPAQVSDVLVWLADAAKESKPLMIDLRYGGCLGCMNHAYNDAVGTLRYSNVLKYGIVDFEDITGGNIDQAENRKPYSRIMKENAYKFVQAMVYDTTQRYYQNKVIESYPLVAPETRDGEPAAIREDQPNRIFTRAHFPNLLFIDGTRINKTALNSLCYFEQNGIDRMLLAERADSTYYVKNQPFRDWTASLLDDDAMLLQLIGPNIYITGSETAGDFHELGVLGAINCVIANFSTGLNNKCSKYVRAPFDYLR